MITIAQAEKMFEQPTIEAIPTGRKRIVIPAYGFAGAEDAKRQEWGPDGAFMEDVKGLVFYNPKDDANQVLKANDGVLLCYDAPGRVEKIEAYLKANPATFMTANKVKQFIEYLKAEVVNDGGKADLWDSDVNFAANLKDAPAKEDIKPGMVFSSVKKNEVYQAIHIPEGERFEGIDQKADKGGAYILRDSKGAMHLIQKEEFLKTYKVTKMPEVNHTNVSVRE